MALLGSGLVISKSQESTTESLLLKMNEDCCEGACNNILQLWYNGGPIPEEILLECVSLCTSDTAGYNGDAICDYLSKGNVKKSMVCKSLLPKDC